MAAGQLWLFDPPKPLVERLGEDFFRALPSAPGVYLMCGASEGMLYVGKARNLRKRLSSYRVAKLPPRSVGMAKMIKRAAFCNSRAVRRAAKVAAMNICTDGVRTQFGESRLQFPALPLAARPALLHWVDTQDLEALRGTLARGVLPPDFLRKLRSMTGGDLSLRFIEQNCRLFAALLLAIEEGSFRDVSLAERERLLRVLAYVRKDEDALPDYTPEGFTDDQQEVRAVTVELGGLLQAFKAWRLRHQVPGMWSDHGVKQTYV
jgi:hypothetical protein